LQCRDIDIAAELIASAAQQLYRWDLGSRRQQLQDHTELSGNEKENFKFGELCRRLIEGRHME
jgi:hypothetical protein